MNKMKHLITIVSLLLVTLGVRAQDFPVYKIYSSNGKSVSYTDMVKKLSEADVTFFGELHNNPISHWLEYEITKSLFEIHGGTLILGAEMFESDQQIIMDEYLSGLIAESKFEEDSRLWSNYSTDYKPLVNFAKENGLRFIGTNIPRRYASMVFKGGFEALETLSEQAKRTIAKLPVEYDPKLPGYEKMLKMGGMGMRGHSNENFPKAQAIKDATMAHFIHLNMKEDSKFIHYNGAYHSDNYEGILWYLNRLNKDYKMKTITTIIQSDVNELAKENQGVADFIIIVDENLTGSY
jgi:uncharacterized iron-regulated protein